MSLCAHLTIYSAFFDLWYLSCLLYNIERVKIFMIIQLHTLHFYNTYIYQAEDNILWITRGILVCKQDKHDLYTLYNQYYYLLLSGKLSFCTLSRNQFSQICASNWRPSNYTLSFHKQPLSYYNIFATNQCNLSTFHSPLNSFIARVKERYRLTIIGQDKQEKVLSALSCIITLS